MHAPGTIQIGRLVVHVHCTACCIYPIHPPFSILHHAIIWAFVCLLAETMRSTIIRFWWKIVWYSVSSTCTSHSKHKRRERTVEQILTWRASTTYWRYPVQMHDMHQTTTTPALAQDHPATQRLLFVRCIAALLFRFIEFLIAFLACASSPFSHGAFGVAVPFPFAEQQNCIHRVCCCHRFRKTHRWIENFPSSNCVRTMKFRVLLNDKIIWIFFSFAFASSFSLDSVLCSLSSGDFDSH